MFTSELFDDIPPPENARKTQIAGTLPTYKKAADMLAKTGVQGKALDFGAGLGHGTGELGPDADSYEPFPGEKFKPHFVDVTKIPDNSYHKIVNLNVLNVVPNAGNERIRDSIVKNIGRVLAPGGVAIITTRGKDVLTIKGTPGEEPMSMISKIGTYQKGFTSAELREYVSGVLGDGFKVSNVKLGPAGVMIKKLAVDEARANDVNFGSGYRPDPWIAYDKANPTKMKKFRTRDGAKAYAEKHNLGFASFGFYFDHVKQGVAEGSLTEFAPGGDGGNGPFDYGTAIIRIGEDYIDHWQDYPEGSGEDAAEIIQVGKTFVSRGMQAGIAALFDLDTFVQDHVMDQLSDQGFNVKADLYAHSPYAKPAQKVHTEDEIRQMILSLLQQFAQTRKEPEDQQEIDGIYKAFQSSMQAGFTTLYNAWEYDLDADFTKFARQHGIDLNAASAKYYKNPNEQGVAEDDHTDEENGMAQDNLNKMSKASQQINSKVKKLGGNKSLEPWQQQLVATAADKVDAVHHSMDDEMEEGIDGRGERHEPELNPGDAIVLKTIKGRTYTGILSHINDDSIVFKTEGEGGNPHNPNDTETRSHVVAIKMSHVASVEPAIMAEGVEPWDKPGYDLLVMDYYNGGNTASEIARKLGIEEEEVEYIIHKHENGLAENEYDDEDDYEDQGFFVAIGSEDEGGFVGMITKDGGKWRETAISGNAPYNWGGSYMSYLSSEDVMQHLRNDYGRHAQVKGPFSTEEAAMQYAQSHFDLGSDAEFGDENYDTLEEQKLQIGDPIVVTYGNEYEGEHGEIIDFSPSGSFVIVRMQNGDEASMHLSDVEYSEHDEDDEDDDGIMYEPPKRRPQRDDLDETVNDPDFERMMGKMTSPDSLKTREAVAMMMELVYHSGASYKEALQQASSSFEIDPAKLQALYQQQLKQQGNPVDEAGNPAQQAAIAIAMKKAGKKPKSESMQSAAHKPTGPSFAGGKWKGTDSATQAKNKYVGSGATESVQHDKQVLEYTINNMKRDGYEFFNEDDNGFDKCWTGYRKVGLKKKGDKMVNDCRPVKKKK